MRPVDLLIEAAEALRRDRRQALLSVAGIVAGVAVVIAAVSISDGAAREALQSVESMGLDNVILRSDRQPLGTEDAVFIGEHVRHAAAVAPVRTARLVVESERRRVPTMVLGVTAAWPAAMNARLRAGRWLSEGDTIARSRVAVIGAPLAARLFAGTAVGEWMRIGSDWYRVVGVAESLDHVLVPLPCLDVRLGSGDTVDRVIEIVVHARRASDVMTLARDVHAAAERSGLHEGVQLVIPRELAAARVRARRSFDLSLEAIGCLVLALGGLGITNVTLAGIARRVTEIGVRRAVGARRRDVVRQIAAECTALSVAGGFIGLPLGVAISLTVGAIAGWKIALTWTGPALALLLSAAVGMASGVYPARVASRWTPCEALRHE